MAKQLKIDTSLLKQLVAELDILLASAQEQKNSVNINDRVTTGKLIIELQKSAGVAAGIAQEATALIMDISQEVRAGSAPAGDNYDALEKILGLKGNPSGGYGSGGGSPFN